MSRVRIPPPLWIRPYKAGPYVAVWSRGQKLIGEKKTKTVKPIYLRRFIGLNCNSKGPSCEEWHLTRWQIRNCKTKQPQASTNMTGTTEVIILPTQTMHCYKGYIPQNHHIICIVRIPPKWVTSWWFQPGWKILVKIGSSSPNLGENKKYLSCHHPGNLITPGTKIMDLRKCTSPSR